MAKQHNSKPDSLARCALVLIWAYNINSIGHADKLQMEYDCLTAGKVIYL